MSIRMVLLAGAAALELGSGPAAASVFTESVQFGPAPTDFNNATGATGGPGGNQLYYFDSNGGSLNSITFNYNFTVSSQITVTNKSTSTASGNARTQSAAQFDSNVSAVTTALNKVVNNYVDPIDGNSVSVFFSTLNPIAADVRGTIGNYTVSPGGSLTLASTGSYSQPNFMVTDSSVLAAFQKAGGGTFMPLFTTLSGLIISNFGGTAAQATQLTTAQGNLVISFNYDTAPPPTTVPEPASMALLGMGVAAVAAVRRRRTA